MPISVLLVDDHAIVREGLRRLLEDYPEIKVVGEATDGNEALRMVRQLKPDVVLMDLSMPGLDGLEVTKRIVDEGLESRVLILTMHANEHYAVRLLRAGAHGFAGKGIASEELAEAIGKVSRGRRYLPAALMDAVPLSYGSKVGGASPLETLSDREFQVLKLLTDGLSGSEIGEKLHLSVKTIDTYRARLLAKLDLSSTAELIRFALRHGVVENTW
ncbi:MAG TPA: response regulator transcription factor [Candidatus Binataceae bacterium]|nr:response regulator transcription factor [Candidatus Binataceae bacterium]